MRMVLGLMAIVLSSGAAIAQSKVTIAVGGSSCLCYLPVVLARELGEYDRAGVSVDLVNLRGGSDTLTAVLSGSVDVATGYFDHCVEIAARKQALQSFVVFDRYPGEVVIVSPVHRAEIGSFSDLAGKTVGVTAPGSTSDFFLKFLLKKSGVDPAMVSVIGIGVGATAVAAVEQGLVDAAVMVDPSATYLQGKHSDLKVLTDTRSERDARSVFGADYPGGALYSTMAWIESHEKEAQALTVAIVRTLAWIHSHSPEEIMAKMPSDLIGKDRELYLSALRNTIPMFSETGRMDPKGAEVVLSVFSQSSPIVAQAHIDVSKTYTNRFVDHVAAGAAPAEK
ncbi:ABC transporter substrate-binding protein [Bradyrhizobium sp. BRP22]|uniref:ABC transporter substrate-binding protein n=1 Tax=Bradyrhizobium sp. BRP22 TaxID=2793821 RepID=UPI001CD4F7FB|nr:ABC transporter substrate-binding protein [Bradyrhizobium sp. BRP22]